jgi:hypothetical protein
LIIWLSSIWSLEREPRVLAAIGLTVRRYHRAAEMEIGWREHGIPERPFAIMALEIDELARAADPTRPRRPLVSFLHGVLPQFWFRRRWFLVLWRPAQDRHFLSGVA